MRSFGRRWHPWEFFRRVRDFEPSSMWLEDGAGVQWRAPAFCLRQVALAAADVRANDGAHADGAGRGLRATVAPATTG